MKVLEWSQRFSHYKYMGIFPNAQGQLTHKSFLGYCSISDPSQILWVSFTVSIHCAPEMSEIDCIGRIKSFWPKFVRGW